MAGKIMLVSAHHIHGISAFQDNSRMENIAAFDEYRVNG